MGLQKFEWTAKQRSCPPISCAIRQQDTLRCSCLWYSAPSQSDSSAPAALMGLSPYLGHLCRCWRSCCSHCFGIDTGFCSPVELVRSESSPLPGPVWSSAETEGDCINVKLLGYFLCNPAGCTPAPALVWSRAGCSGAWCYLGWAARVGVC